mmetsp:Transcript_32879/g.55909  ORF Transcript_32879/g.55909 Transcript_32879/m.55909 type:complete len:139 (-) Transcript_32879:311-727(-)
MPGSNKTERNRVLKANRAAGIGDEMGRLPVRVKDPGILLTCLICKTELKCTKSNTEMKKHATSKHGKANYEECFQGAEAHAKALLEKVTKGGAGGPGAGGKSADGLTKAERKKKAAAGLDDLLSAGLSTGKSGKKKGR